MDTRPRRGRPSKVTPEDIARAAMDIGLDRANIKNVAEALGMSIPGLYHKFKTRDDLIAFAIELYSRRFSEYNASNVSYGELLAVHARRLYELYLDQPAILARVIDGHHAFATMPLYLDKLLQRGVACGFTPAEAYEIMSRVVAATIGAAVTESAAHALAGRGQSLVQMVGSSATDVPQPPMTLDRFESVHVMLAGLRTHYGARLDALPATEP